MSSATKKGLFIVLDGLDFSGKTTMMPVVVKWVTDRGRECVRVRAPGGTPLGERVRSVIMACHADNTIDPFADVLLFTAAKRQLYHDVIRPALDAGKIVVADRWVDSLFAYQGAGFGVKGEAIQRILDSAKVPTAPDLTIHLDVSRPERERRRAARAEESNALDTKPEKFYQAARTAYQFRATCFSQRIVEINASKTQDRVAKAIQKCLDQKLGHRV